MILRALDPRVICAMLTLCFSEISRWVSSSSRMDLTMRKREERVSFSSIVMNRLKRSLSSFGVFISRQSLRNSCHPSFVVLFICFLCYPDFAP